MIYPENFEDKLHFGRIRAALRDLCLGQMATELVDEMEFSTDYEQIALRTSETAEMLDILTSDAEFPPCEVPDLREALSRIRIEGLYLDEVELVALCNALKHVKGVALFFTSTSAELYPRLRQRTAEIAVFPLLIERIEHVIDKYGRIRDNASPALAEIRRDMQTKQSAVNKRLAAILKQAQADGYVEADASVTIRDGRTVIPVPSANKRRMNGIVLDESSTGRTSFIEPAEVVALNNELRELSYAERREIIKILTEVSSVIRPYSAEILASFATLAHLDFVRAKAKYAQKTHSVLPTFEDRQGIYWVQARHPLLFLQLQSQHKSIVPLDIELEAPQQRILLISGPNAGGKSVCLQTVGIIQYMFQCGMLVPMAEGSKMGLFAEIFIDMGDEQSIENDLSTYSSHLTNMKHFVRYGTSQSLILIDEFGTGTEPMLGGAIAESVLAELNSRGVFGVITTHYTNLKHYAAQTDGLLNSAMLFDTHAIQPLFKLQMGQPGSSFAFEIARKIGLPERILDVAREKMGQEHLDFDKHLREIVRDKNYWEQKRKKIKETEKRLDETLAKYDEALQGIKAQRREILEGARQQSQNLLEEANKKIERTIREIKHAQAEKERTKNARAEMDAFKQEVKAIASEPHDDAIEREIERIRKRQERKAQRQKSASTTPAEQMNKPLPLEVGASVSIDGSEAKVGEVVALGSREATVAIGAMQMQVKLDRLKVLTRGDVKRSQRQTRVVLASNVGDAVRAKKLNFKPEIDVRGMRTDEAIEAVAIFLDEAIVCEATRLSILHGKGNGILRQMLRQYLHTLPFVKSVADEHVQMGGAGITVVEIE